MYAHVVHHSSKASRHKTRTQFRNVVHEQRTLPIATAPSSLASVHRTRPNVIDLAITTRPAIVAGRPVHVTLNRTRAVCAAILQCAETKDDAIGATKRQDKPADNATKQAWRESGRTTRRGEYNTPRPFFIVEKV